MEGKTNCLGQSGPDQCPGSSGSEPKEGSTTQGPSRRGVVGKTLGEELKRTSAMLVTKLKNKLAKLANSLKATLVTAKACREKMRQD
ncbi:hypothetical protein VNO80_25496 [Phaseolus coccineus]|uniref:Uncharacterized protein n=1 Tax=Phaseolus coccineus TaxID=3886 RepID=A0AAN9LUZ1_PHACN